MRLWGGTPRPTERKDAVTRRASAGPSYVFAGNPYEPNWDLDRVIRDGYERVIWVNRIVDARATNGARLPVVMRVGRGEEARTISDHPLLDLLNRRANPYETGRAFRYRLLSQFQLSKKGVFVEVVENRRGQASSLHLLNPLHTWVVPDPDKFISEFEVRVPDGETWRLPPYSAGEGGGVIWIRKPHPTDPYSSNTWLESAGLSIDLDFYARLYNRTFMQNDGRPGGLLSVNGDVDEEVAAQLQARMSGGVGSAGIISVVEAEGISYIDTSTTPRDAQYVESRDITKNEILVAGGTPLSVIGDASGRTFDNADAEFENFWRVTMIPDLEILASYYDLLTEGGWDDDRSIEHDTSSVSVLQREAESRRKEALGEFEKGLITIDEYRAVGNRDSVDSPAARTLWIPAGKTPVAEQEDFDAVQALYGGGGGAPPPEGGEQPALPPGEAAPGEAPQDGPPGLSPEAQSLFGDLPVWDAEVVSEEEGPPRSLRALMAAEGKALPAGGSKPHGGAADLNPEDLAAAREHAAKIAEPHMEAVAEAVRAFMESQEGVVLARLTGAKGRKHTRHWVGGRDGEVKALDPTYIIDRSRWITELASSIARFLLDAYADAVRDTSERLGSDPDQAVIDGEAARAVIADIVRGIADYFDRRAGRLQDVIAKADERGASMDEIAEKVRKEFLNADTWAEATSTAVVGAMNAGSTAAAVDAGATLKRWLATDDERTRLTHREAEGQVKEMAAPFIVGGQPLMYPGDRSNPAAIGEWINCRCSLLFQLPERSDSLFDAELDEDLADLDAWEAEMAAQEGAPVLAESKAARRRPRVGRIGGDPGGWWQGTGFLESLVVRDTEGRFVDRLGGTPFAAPELLSPASAIAERRDAARRRDSARLHAEALAAEAAANAAAGLDPRWVVDSRTGIGHTTVGSLHRGDRIWTVPYEGTGVALPALTPGQGVPAMAVRRTVDRIRPDGDGYQVGFTDGTSAPVPSMMAAVYAAPNGIPAPGALRAPAVIERRRDLARRLEADRRHEVAVAEDRAALAARGLDERWALGADGLPHTTVAALHPGDRVLTGDDGRLAKAGRVRTVEAVAGSEADGYEVRFTEGDPAPVGSLMDGAYAATGIAVPESLRSPIEGGGTPTQADIGSPIRYAGRTWIPGVGRSKDEVEVEGILHSLTFVPPRSSATGKRPPGGNYVVGVRSPGTQGVRSYTIARRDWEGGATLTSTGLTEGEGDGTIDLAGQDPATEVPMFPLPTALRFPQANEPTVEDLDGVAGYTSSDLAVDDAAAVAAGAPEVEIADPDGEIPVVESKVSYEVYASNLGTAKALIDRANRRAERTGIPYRFSYEVERFDRKRSRNGVDEVIPMARITLNRPTIKHNGWTFVGTLTWDEGGLVTRLVPGESLAVRPEAKRCDACGTARNRIDTYLVRGPDGQEQQVGSNCLETFLGVRPGSLWMLGWDDLSSQTGGDGEDPWGDGGGGGETRYDPVGMLALGLAVTEKYGWVPRSKADEWGRKATVDVMMEVLYPIWTRNEAHNQELRAFIEDVTARAAELDDKAEEVLTFAREIEGDNDYVQNLRAVADGTTVSRRNVALLVSAIAAKMRRDETRAKREVMADKSEWIGEVGDKIAKQPARIVGVRYIEGRYGVTTLLTFVTPEGNVVKWFASGSHEYEIGDDVVIDRATIKGHGEWQGVKETQVTRAKLSVVEKAA